MLPDSLTHAIYQASESVITAMEAGSDRVLVRARLQLQAYMLMRQQICYVFLSHHADFCTSSRAFSG